MRVQLSFMLLLIASLTGCAEPPDTRAGGADLAGTLVTATPDMTSLPQPVTETGLLDCQAMKGLTVHCGYKNPEDLVILPGKDHLLVSEMGEFLLDSPGQLSLLNLATGMREPLSISWSADGVGKGKGDEGCPMPDVQAFSPHGIDLTRLDDGSLQLLVVNHGKRESVEFFDVTKSEDAWQLTWQGCALPPGDPFINDVAGRHDGGFYVTHMWDKKTDFAEVGRRLMAGEPTGWVWAWQADNGFTRLPDSMELMPNGIAISPDNAAIYINIYMGDKTIRMNTVSGEVDGSFDVRQPDNISVDDNGDLWVASHQHDALGQTCAQVEAGPCLLPYDVIKADPVTLETEVVLHQAGAPMGYATIAIRVGDHVYMGSAHGDRIASMKVGGDMGSE